MSIENTSVSRREAVVTLVPCVLLGWEVVPNLLFSVAILLGFEPSPYASLYSTLGYEILLDIPGLVLGAWWGWCCSGKAVSPYPRAGSGGPA